MWNPEITDDIVNLQTKMQKNLHFVVNNLLDKGIKVDSIGTGLHPCAIGKPVLSIKDIVYYIRTSDKSVSIPRTIQIPDIETPINIIQD